MACVLVTRPRPSSETTAAILRNLGYQTVIEPLLSMAPLQEPCPASGSVDAIMITSGNALAALEGRRNEISNLLDTPCFCIGDRTTEKARAFGFRNTHSAAGDGPALASLAGAVLGGAGASILHAAARDGNGIARRELEKLGHRVTVWPVYEAIPVTALTASVRRLLKEKACNAVLLYSPRTAAVLTTLLDKDMLETCCPGLPAICLSEAVAEVLRPSGWRHLVVAPQPTEDAMIACLQKTCPVKND